MEQQTVGVSIEAKFHPFSYNEHEGITVFLAYERLGPTERKYFLKDLDRTEISERPSSAMIVKQARVLYNIRDMLASIGDDVPILDDTSNLFIEGLKGKTAREARAIADKTISLLEDYCREQYGFLNVQALTQRRNAPSLDEIECAGKPN